MTALSQGGEQPLRQIAGLGPGRVFGLMPGSLLAQNVFGAKLVSVFADSSRQGLSRHQGVVVVFDYESGAAAAIADAEAVTTIRTGCASAAATDALARADASVLAIFGAGRQAKAHLRALTLIRNFETIILWGRDADETRRKAEASSAELGLTISAISDAATAAEQAHVICTVSSSMTPMVLGRWISPGTHINLVGSSHLGPVEVDAELVLKGRYFADYRPAVLAQASELSTARDAGLLSDDHVVGEIGEVFGGKLKGRQDDAQITIYKSLGHVAQDLAAVCYLQERAEVELVDLPGRGPVL